MKNFIQKYLLILLFFSGIQAVSGQTAALQDSMVKGNQLYTSGKYAEAAKTYEAIASKGFDSFELYYNLGNALYKTNNITFAILNYERALKLSPTSEDSPFQPRNGQEAGGRQHRSAARTWVPALVARADQIEACRWLGYPHIGELLPFSVAVCPFSFLPQPSGTNSSPSGWPL